MSRPKPLTLLLMLALFVAGGCGGASVASEVPRTTPDLTVPGGAAGAEALAPSTTSTAATAPTTAATTPAPVTPAPATPAPSPGTGGTGTGTTGAGTGGSPAQGFDQFCTQNPGAC